MNSMTVTSTPKAFQKSANSMPMAPRAHHAVRRGLPGAHHTAVRWVMQNVCPEISGLNAGAG